MAGTGSNDKQITVALIGAAALIFAAIISQPRERQAQKLTTTTEVASPTAPLAAATDAMTTITTAPETDAMPIPTTFGSVFGTIRNTSNDSNNGKSRTIRLINKSEHSIIGLFFSPPPFTQPGKNRLGRLLLKSGDFMSALIDNGGGVCIYQVTADFADHSSNVYSIDVCSTSKLEIDDAHAPSSKL